MIRVMFICCVCTGIAVLCYFCYSRCRRKIHSNTNPSTNRGRDGSQLRSKFSISSVPRITELQSRAAIINEDYNENETW